MPKDFQTAEQIAAKKVRDDERAEMLAKARRRMTADALDALDKGFTLTGVRLSDPADDHATGCVVTLDENEQVAWLKTLRTILQARK